MATQIGLGISTTLDSFAAGREAARTALCQLNRQEPNILIGFISTIFDQAQVIKGLRSIIREAPLVGCSTAASITMTGAISNSVAVCALSSNTISFSYGVGDRISKNPRMAGNEAARESSYLKDVTKQVYIMFSDSLSGNMADVLRGAQEVRGTSFPIIGGSATDDFKFQKTYQYLNNSIYTDAVVGLLLGGNIDIGIGAAHGWQPIGRPHRVTRARSNILKEIDRKKAIELYEEYLDKTSDELKIEDIAKLGSRYPLGMQIKEKKEYLTRTPLKIHENGGLILTAEIPEREDINLMIGDKNLALEATRKACVEAVRNLDRAELKFALVFSDIARLQLLRKGSDKEVEIIKDVLGKGVPVFGCYTCGEYAPINIPEYIGQSYFHNQAISIVVFSERA